VRQFRRRPDEAELLRAACPGLSELVRENRAFLDRAVTWAAGQGIAQFIDLGTGLPLRPAVHESARAVLPDARIAYVDNDPMVCSYVQALPATDERVQAAQADLKDASAVLGHQAVKAVINPAEPVCVILGAAPNLISAGKARNSCRQG
jgi:S-adenosyl methyltransferase